MKKTPLLFLFFLYFSPTYAQNLSVGISMGANYNFSTFKKLDNNQAPYELAIIEHKFRPSIGIYADYKIGKKISVGLETSYTNKIQRQQTYYDKNGNMIGYKRVQYAYLNVLPSIKYSPAKYLGISIGYNHAIFLGDELLPDFDILYGGNIIGAFNLVNKINKSNSSVIISAEYQIHKFKIVGSYALSLNPISEFNLPVPDTAPAWVTPAKTFYYSPSISLQIKYAIFPISKKTKNNAKNLLKLL